jgi:putative Mn2+ efflux pump MntP
MRFIRKNGRVIPIQEGSGTRGGNLRAARNLKQKIGAPIAGVAGLAAGLGYSVGKINHHFCPKLKKFIGASLAVGVGATVLSHYGNKQRSKESKLLNK